MPVCYRDEAINSNSRRYTPINADKKEAKKSEFISVHPRLILLTLG